MCLPLTAPIKLPSNVRKSYLDLNTWTGVGGWDIRDVEAPLTRQLLNHSSLQYQRYRFESKTAWMPKVLTRDGHNKHYAFLQECSPYTLVVPNSNTVTAGRPKKLFNPLNIAIVLRFFFSEFSLLNPLYNLFILLLFGPESVLRCGTSEWELNIQTSDQRTEEKEALGFGKW